MSDVTFLVSRPVLEVRANPVGDNSIIFELGDKQEPALYADVARCIYLDRGGRPRPLTMMVGAVVRATSTEGGRLAISFADGSTVLCEPDDDFEAWEVVGGEPQSLVVCLPGGELAVFDSSYIPSETEARDIVERLNEWTGWSGQFREITDRGGIIVDPRPQPQDGTTEPGDG